MGKFPVRSLLIAAAVLGLVIFIASQNNARNQGQTRNLTYFLREVDAGAIESIVVRENEIHVTPRSGDNYVTRVATPFSTEEIERLNQRGVEVEVAARGQNWGGILITLLPILLMIGFLWYLMRGMRGGGDSAMQFGKSKARMISEENSQTLFKDVAGVEEAKADLHEVVEFLKNPNKFHALGARIPHGVLMVGPPGSGKTHLAKAVAGEAKVPFFSISGSDFVEMFVGVGAARVRDLFENAKKSAPCIVFIDEIDAVGRRRGMNLNGGNDEREQTLNALLVEMDGFESKHDIIIIAATNRPDVLDPALLRPGRFDRQVVVDAPDVKGREAILHIHARGKPLAKGVNLKTIARRTPGFVGADLENLINEAALVAARAGRKEIFPQDIDEAVDRVMMGPERRSLVISDKRKQIVAFHEAGHALAGYMLEYADPVHKITIVPRGRAGGYVLSLPEEDRDYTTRNMLLDGIAKALAGRAAEEIVFADITTGAQNDFQQATDIARRMVTTWGMSDALGKIALASSNQSYLGDYEGQRTYSEATARLIDAEVKAIIDQQYQRVMQILQKNRTSLDTIVRILLERETIHADEFELIMQGKPLEPNDDPPLLNPDLPSEPSPKSSKAKPPLPPTMLPKLG